MDYQVVLSLSARADLRNIVRYIPWMRRIAHFNSVCFFWIIVNKLPQKPTAFIMKPAEVKERAHRREKDGRISFWLQPTAYDQPVFREAWVRLPNAPIPSDDGSL